MDTESPSSTVEGLLGKIERYGRPTGALDASPRELGELVEACRRLLLQHAVSMLANSGHTPWLLQFSLDTTPLRTRKALAAASGPIQLRRAGKTTSDYLVQQVFLTTTTDHGIAHAAVFREATVLQYTKQNPALAACALTCPGLGLAVPGERRVAIKHQVHDRGITAGLLQVVSGYWEHQRLQYEEEH